MKRETSQQTECGVAQFVQKDAPQRVNYDSVHVTELSRATKFSHRLIKCIGNEVIVEFTCLANGVTTDRTLLAERTPYANAANDLRELARMERAADKMFGPLKEERGNTTAEAAKARALRESRRKAKRDERVGPAKGAGGSKQVVSSKEPPHKPKKGSKKNGGKK